MNWPSEKAQQAAYAATQDDDGMIPVSTLALAFEATHDPTLGLDRSVCLRDVVWWMMHSENDRDRRMAVEIEREFGGGA
jgi:hypothetical protein